MHKRYIVMISTMLMVAAFLLIKGIQEHAFVFFNPVSEAIADEIWTEKVRVERFDFQSLLCNGIQIPMDVADKTFYVPLNMESDEWETMEFSSGDPNYLICFSEDFTKINKKPCLSTRLFIDFLFGFTHIMTAFIAKSIFICICMAAKNVCTIIFVGVRIYSCINCV